MERFSVATRYREEMINITQNLEELVIARGWRDGALLVFCPHTTAGLTINEAADPDVQTDMTLFMKKLVPKASTFRHTEGNSDAHIKSSLLGPHCLVIVEESRLCLGTWQGLYLCEWDGPRTRQVWVKFLPGS